MKKLILLFIFPIFISCSTSLKDPKISYIKREDVKIKDIIGEKIEFPFIVNGNEIFLKYNDTVLIIGNARESKKDMLELYNFKTGGKIRGVFKFGKGRYKVISSMFGVKGDNLFMLDRNDQKIVIMDIPKLLSDTAYMPSVYPTIGNLYADADFLSKDTLITTVTGHYYDFVTIAKKYNKGVPRLFLMDLKRDTIEIGGDWDFTDFVFLGNHQKEKIAVNIDLNRVVTVSSSLPEITIYDLNLNILKIMIGPNIYDQPIKVTDGRASSDGFYYSFKEIYKTRSGFFVVNSNVIAEKTVKGIDKPSEILEFDWDGKLLNIYQLDRDVFSVSVVGNSLYGTTFDYGTKKTGFYKFNLN